MCNACGTRDSRHGPEVADWPDQVVTDSQSLHIMRYIYLYCFKEVDTYVVPFTLFIYAINLALNCVHIATVPVDLEV